MVHHEDDDASDQFWQMQENMTVFGFGRQYMCCDTYLTAVPNVFTVGLAEATDIPTATAIIESAWRPLSITLGEPETR